MFKNLKIGVRLGMGFGLVIILLIVTAFIGHSRIANLDGELAVMNGDRFPKVVQANQIIDSINNINRLLRNAYIYSGEEKQKALDAIPLERKTIVDTLEILDKTIRSDQGKALLKTINSTRADYLASYNKFLELLKEERREEIVALMQGDLRKTQTDYMASVNALIDFQTSMMDKAGKDAAAEADAAQQLLIILAIAATLIALVFAWWVTRSITRPVNQALDAASRIAEGDLTVKIESDSKDEVGMLMSAMQAMIGKLTQIIGEVRTAADNLTNAAGQVSATAQSLSQSSSEQAASVEETTASMEQMTASISQNTENAKVTDGMASKSAKEAAEGGDAVNKTVDDMKSIASKIGIIDDIA